MSKDKDNKPTEDTAAASSKDTATVTSKEKETKENSKETTAIKGAASKVSDEKTVDNKSDGVCKYYKHGSVSTKCTSKRRCYLR